MRKTKSGQKKETIKKWRITEKRKPNRKKRKKKRNVENEFEQVRGFMEERDRERKREREEMRK